MKKSKLLFPLLFVVFATFISCDNDNPDVDLQAADLTFTATGIDPNLQDFEGTAVITGYVTNIGMDNYVSGANQQTINIDEVSLGGARTNVASLSFSNLNAGDTLVVSYSRNWNISSPAEGEFPPNYELYISLDPDIFIDGNKENDDTNQTNNQITESGQQINDLF